VGGDIPPLASRGSWGRDPGAIVQLGELRKAFRRSSAWSNWIDQKINDLEATARTAIRKCARHIRTEAAVAGQKEQRMSQYWPGETAWSPIDGTHRVARGNREAPGTWLFLRAAKGLIDKPSWTASESEAGRWSLPDARLLAAMHSGANESGIVADTWVVTIIPPWLGT
jgi:hypothetical protein